MKEPKRFIETLRGKVIVTFIFIIVSAAIMWSVNKVAFEKITSLVGQLTEPDKKWEIAQSLSKEISNLSHLQQTEVLKGKEKISENYENQLEDIFKNVGLLQSLVKHEPLQVSRLNSITSYLLSGKKLFQDYLALRYDLEQRKIFEKQLNILSRKLEVDNTVLDSSIVTSEKKTKTKTFIPTDTIEVDQKQSWIKRIFSKPKKETIVIPQEPLVVVEEEFKVKVDTLSVAKTDTTRPKLSNSLRSIERKRLQKLSKLEKSEKDLLKANQVLISQIKNLLQEVEEQELLQVKRKTSATVILAERTIHITRIITITLVTIALLIAILMLVDVTKSRKYRKELEAAKGEADYHSSAKQRFLANMSHEIRTPLQSIIGYSEQQLKDKVLNRPYVEAIYHSSNHLLQVVNEVLDYSKIISGKFTFNREVFDVRNVLKEVISAIKLQTERKVLELTVDTTGVDQLGWIVGDSFRLKQVLLNLLGNAVKFTEKGAIKLTVSSKEINGRVQLTFIVDDTGVGIAEEEIDHVFTRFERASGVSKNFTGTGLGLTIVKELVEAQQGSITLVSKPGRGSTFTVKIPYEYASEITGIELNGDKQVLEFEGKVWLVDDDSLIRNLGSIILGKHNIKHECFSSAEELLDEKWADDVKIIFTDVRLPGIDGMELCRILRQKVANNTKIIALTAQVMPEERASAYKNGFDDLLLKPFLESDFINVLNKLKSSEIPVRKIDLNLLEKMVGDRQQLQLILKQCFNETVSDAQLLQTAVFNDNYSETALIIHRLAGRIGQVGERKLAKRLRKTEVAIRSQNTLVDIKDDLFDVLADIDDFIEMLEQELETTVC